MLIISSDNTAFPSGTSLPQSQHTVCRVCTGEKLPKRCRASGRWIPTPVGWHNVYLPSLTALKLCCLAITQHKFTFLWHTRILDSQVFVHTRAVFNPWGLQNVMSGRDLAVFFIITQTPYNRGGCRIAEAVSDRISVLRGADFRWQAAPESFLYCNTWPRREAFQGFVLTSANDNRFILKKNWHSLLLNTWCSDYSHYTLRIYMSGQSTNLFLGQFRFLVSQLHLVLQFELREKVR